MDSDSSDDWGVQVGGPPIEEILDNQHNNPNVEKKEVDKNNTICLGTRINKQ